MKEPGTSKRWSEKKLREHLAAEPPETSKPPEGLLERLQADIPKNLILPETPGGQRHKGRSRWRPLLLAASVVFTLGAAFLILELQRGLLETPGDLPARTPAPESNEAGGITSRPRDKSRAIPGEAGAEKERREDVASSLSLDESRLESLTERTAPALAEPPGGARQEEYDVAPTAPAARREAKKSLPADTLADDSATPTLGELRATLEEILGEEGNIRAARLEELLSEVRRQARERPDDQELIELLRRAEEAATPPPTNPSDK